MKQEDFDKLYALPSLWEERTECPQLVTAFPPFFLAIKTRTNNSRQFHEIEKESSGNEGIRPSALGVFGVGPFKGFQAVRPSQPHWQYRF